MRTAVLLLMLSISTAWLTVVLPMAHAERPAMPGRHLVVHKHQGGEPYGGCDEAWQAPKSPGARWCRAHGYIR